MLKVRAPAKLNLTLEVLFVQPEGYHEIRSVLQTIDMHDTLYLAAADGVTFNSDNPAWWPEKSLLTRAVALLQTATGCKQGVAVRLEKRIPLMAGLGGDSSDAAALLRGLNKLWGLGLSLAGLAELAAQLGSDVTYFLYRGTALAKGRGDTVTPLSPLPGMWVVLVMPDVPARPGKTAWMYAALKPEHFTDGHITQKLVEALHNKDEINPTLLFNTFENVAFKDKMFKVYLEHLMKLGATHVHLAGSGPALFMMFLGKERAVDIYWRCREQGMKAYLTQTL
jgi:4-diphosphocytidyl-2-C-methyl-D-erythritol kinase